MAMRYFKATDGTVTVFRASKTRIYRSAWFTRYDGERSPSGTQGFSAKPAHPAHLNDKCASKNVPTVEISKAEYDKLVEIKNRRFDNPRYAAPQDSWVLNYDLEG